MKRRTSTLRPPAELKADTRGQYGEYIKHPSKINPVFTNKPWLGEKKDERRLQDQVN
jgi:hypothetical protein